MKCYSIYLVKRNREKAKIYVVTRSPEDDTAQRRTLQTVNNTIVLKHTNGMKHKPNENKDKK